MVSDLGKAAIRAYNQIAYFNDLMLDYYSQAQKSLLENCNQKQIICILIGLIKIIAVFQQPICNLLSLKFKDSLLILF